MSAATNWEWQPALLHTALHELIDVLHLQSSQSWFSQCIRQCCGLMSTNAVQDEQDLCRGQAGVQLLQLMPYLDTSFVLTAWHQPCCLVPHLFACVICHQTLLTNMKAVDYPITQTSWYDHTI